MDRLCHSLMAIRIVITSRLDLPSDSFNASQVQANSPKQNPHPRSFPSKVSKATLMLIKNMISTLNLLINPMIIASNLPNLKERVVQVTVMLCQRKTDIK